MTCNDGGRLAWTPPKLLQLEIERTLSGEICNPSETQSGQPLPPGEATYPVCVS